MTTRAAFVTIGQAPRVDVVPEMVQRIGGGLDIETEPEFRVYTRRIYQLSGTE